MNRMVLSVVRSNGGWTIEHERRALATYLHQEQAIAHARLMGRDAWDHGRPCRIVVHEVSGRSRWEYTYGEQLD